MFDGLTMIFLAAPPPPPKTTIRLTLHTQSTDVPAGGPPPPKNARLVRDDDGRVAEGGKGTEGEKGVAVGRERRRRKRLRRTRSDIVECDIKRLR